MTAPGLVVSAHEGFLRGLEEEHLGEVPGAPQLPEDLDDRVQVLTLPDVDAERDAGDPPGRVGAELSERRDERRRQVVHAVVAEVLEAFDGPALPRAGQARDDDEAQALARLRLGEARSSRLARQAPLRRPAAV